jgi:hypothetical protein
LHGLRPLSVTAVIRPGRSLPDQGSWELRAFEGGAIELFKVFRVDTKRVAEKDNNAEGLRSDLSTEVIVYPPQYKSGEVIYPYEKALKK